MPEVRDFLLNLAVSLSLMKSSSKIPHVPFSRAVQGSALKELAFAIIKFILSKICVETKEEGG